MLFLTCYIQRIMAGQLPLCQLNQSICTLKDTGKPLTASSYCFVSSSSSSSSSSSFGNIYMGVDSSSGKCVSDDTYMTQPGNYFFNEDHQLMRSANTVNAGYLCYSSYGTKCQEMMTGFYLNSISKTNNYVVAYVASESTPVSPASPLTPPTTPALTSTTRNIFIKSDHHQFFINSGVERESLSKKKKVVAFPLLECNDRSCYALSLDLIPSGYYSNDGDTSQSTLIHCDKRDCTIVEKPAIGYYLNADYNRSFSSSSSSSLNSYHLQRPILHCNESQGTCTLKDLTSLDPGYYIDEGSNLKDTLIYCDTKECRSLSLSPSSSSSSSSTTTTTTTTTSTTLSPGYYINAGDSSAPIITCTQKTCSSGPDLGLPKMGSYLFNENENSLKFRYIDADTIGSNSDLPSESLFIFVELNVGSFPGVTVTPIQTLIKISKSSISLVIAEGYLPIGKSNLKLKTGAVPALPMDIDLSMNLYYCSELSKLCYQKTFCPHHSFLLNPVHHKAYYCEDNTLKEVSHDGYYINGGRKVKSSTPYLIACYKGICEDLKSPHDYYINAGATFDSPKKTVTATATEEAALIYCNQFNCKKIVAAPGYYLTTMTPGEKVNRGIIHCTSEVSCEEMRNGIEHKYFINTGALPTDNNNLIHCNNQQCQLIPAASGFYVAPHPSQLIFCPSSSRCSLYDPDIGYYFLAESSNTNTKKIITCYEKQEKIYCEVLGASPGYYVSPQKGILIDCLTKESHCFAFVAHDGFYRSATTRYTTYSRDLDLDFLDLSEPFDNMTTVLSSSSILPSTLETSVSLPSTVVSSPSSPSSSTIVSSTTSSPQSTIVSSTSSPSTVVSSTSSPSTIVSSSSLPSSSSSPFSSSSSSSTSSVTSTFYSSPPNSDFDALKEVSSSSSVTLPDSNPQLVNNELRSGTNMAYNIIRCVSGECRELSSSELFDIPYCTFNNDKCFVDNNPLINSKIITHVHSGEICTNYDRSIIYFATDEIDLETDTIDVTLSTYTYTTTTTNCVIVSKQYTGNYFTVGHQIYQIDEGRVTKLVTPGYYFIHTDRNVLLTSRSQEDSYNDEVVKLFKCDGTRCSIVDRPSSLTYYADVNKHIVQYDPLHQKYSFPYEKDIICIYERSRCIPKFDLNKNELCITYKGELALVYDTIIAYETGGCYKSASITTNIYGLSRSFYKMDSFSAEKIINSGFYFTVFPSNEPINTKKFPKFWSPPLTLYGCIDHECDIYAPYQNSYYLDALTQAVLYFEEGHWQLIEGQGYLFLRVHPNRSHLYKISKSALNDFTVEAVQEEGFYHTMDNDMYECRYDKKNVKEINCHPISENDYYFTKEGKIYYCLYDAFKIEKTQCTQQLCFEGQYYFFKGKYYQCLGKDSLYVPVSHSNCNEEDTVVIHYPIVMKDLFPERVTNMLQYMYDAHISDIESNYNSSYIPSITGLFKDCRYDSASETATFDLICIKNFVLLSAVRPPQLCSIRRMGYVECKEDEDHPGRCHPNSAWSLHHHHHSFHYSAFLSFLPLPLPFFFSTLVYLFSHLLVFSISIIVLMYGL